MKSYYTFVRMQLYLMNSWSDFPDISIVNRLRLTNIRTTSGDIHVLDNQFTSSDVTTETYNSNCLVLTMTK